MADALDEEWWLQDEDVTSKKCNKKDNKKKKDTKDSPGKDEKKKGIKRKADEKELKTKQKGQKNKKKRQDSESIKKHQRKRITDEPDEVLSRPGTAEDLTALLSKTLKDKLDEKVVEDVLPSAENDFHPCNGDLLEPSKYLKTILPKWKTVVKKSLFMKKNGSPSLLIITSSAIRAVELNRQIKDFLDGKSKVAKLFAKHMKMEDQKKFLSKTNCQVGIGTPGRLMILIQQGALQLESLVAVVLDWNWRDTKLKRMADIPEIWQDLVMLMKDRIVEVVQGSPCKLALL